MARGFDTTFGSASTDKISGASWVTPTEFSFAAWIWRNGEGGLFSGRIFDKTGVNGPAEIRLFRSVSANFTLTRDRSTDSSHNTTDANAVAAGKWIHICVAHDGTTGAPIFYVNGNSVTVNTTNAGTGALTLGSGEFTLGNRSSSGTQWDGMIGGRPTVWGKVLTRAEVVALFSGADPAFIQPYYIMECIDLGAVAPRSLIYSTQPIVTGTKIRADRQAIADITRFPFASANAAQSITPSLFSNTNSFFAPTVVAGAVDLTPGIFSNTNSFPAATVSSSYGLTPGLFSGTNVFHSATVAPGAVDLTPSLFTNSNSFHAPTVSPGVVNLTPSLFSDSNTFYSATVTLDGASQDIAPSLFTNSNDFYAATVSPGAVDISPVLFSNTSTFYAPAVSASYTVTAPLFTNSNSFFSPTVHATYALIASIFGNTNTFHSPTVSAGAVDLTPSLLSNSNTFYGPVVGLDGQIIVVPLFANTNAFYAATVEIPTSRLTGSRPTSAASRLRANLATGSRTNIQTGARPAARG